MSDRISLRGMAFHGFTGVYPEEQERGQRFEIDLDLILDLEAAVTQDDLAATIDYGAVFRRVGEVVEAGRFKLIEALAGAVAQTVFDGFPVDELTVRVRKPAAPLPGEFETVEVELHRRRNGR